MFYLDRGRGVWYTGWALMGRNFPENRILSNKGQAFIQESRVKIPHGPATVIRPGESRGVQPEC